jgi:F420-dependent oxidoreductase-like protein
MQLRVMTEPQEGATYDDLLSVARTAEELGYDAFFRSDHYQRINAGDPGPGSTDAWTTLAGLARDTERIRLGTMVSAVTFRLPGIFAIQVATVDAMSAGRVEVGFGSGWYEREHTSYGIPFPPVGERFDMLEEYLEVVTGLWTTPDGETYSFDGAHYHLADSPALPRPTQRPRPPVVVGGKGPKRTPRLVARFADEHNVPFSTEDETRAAHDRARRACEEAGRDPATVLYTAAQTIAVGRDEAEVERRAQFLEASPADLRAGGLGGTVGEVVDKIGRFTEMGVSRIYLQLMDLSDLDQLRLIAEEVTPQVR